MKQTSDRDAIGCLIWIIMGCIAVGVGGFWGYPIGFLTFGALSFLLILAASIP